MEPWAYKEWQEAQSMCSKHVKYKLPGPMTIIGSTTSLLAFPKDLCPLLRIQCVFAIAVNILLSDEYYKEEKECSMDLVKYINREVRALSDAGCMFIQIDEPVIAIQPEKALEYGIDHLKLCFEVDFHSCCCFPLTLF